MDFGKLVKYVLGKVVALETDHKPLVPLPWVLLQQQRREKNILLNKV